MFKRPAVCLNLNATCIFKQRRAMPRHAFATVAEIAAVQHGYVTQQAARAAGVAATTLARMAERGTLVRASHGVYRVPLIPVGPLDQYMEATLWPRGVRGTLSHETALDLYDLSDVSPAKIHITVPRAHRVQRAVPALYVVHRADLRDDEITAFEGIPIVTPARAVLDAHAASLGPALIAQAIDDGQRRGVFDREQAAQLRDATGTTPG
jgi:predicted transcriptional regulator of viral defense system